jgi:hypothetical protein
MQASKSLPSQAMSGQTQYDLEVLEVAAMPHFKLTADRKLVAQSTSAAELWRTVMPAKQSEDDKADGRQLLRAFGLTSAAVFSQLLVRIHPFSSA